MLRIENNVIILCNIYESTFWVDEEPFSDPLNQTAVFEIFVAVDYYSVMDCKRLVFDFVAVESVQFEEVSSLGPLEY